MANRLANACKTFLNRGRRYIGCYNSSGQFRIKGLAGAGVGEVGAVRKRKSTARGKFRLISDVGVGEVSGTRKRKTAKRRTTRGRSRRYV